LLLALVAGIAAIMMLVPACSSTTATPASSSSPAASVDTAADLGVLMHTTPATVGEVLYNALHQEPARAFGEAARHGLGLIAKVPLDSGWLSGKYGSHSRFEGIRARWTPADIACRAAVVDQVRALLPAGVTLPQAALAFILAHPEVATVIPGVRDQAQLEANLAAARVRLTAATVSAIEALWRDRIAALNLPGINHYHGRNVLTGKTQLGFLLLGKGSHKIYSLEYYLPQINDSFLR